MRQIASRYLSKYNWFFLVLALAVMDLSIRHQQLPKWSLEEFFIYFLSIQFSLAWAYFLRTMLAKWANQHKVLVAGGISLFALGSVLVYLSSYGFYFQFKSMPNTLTLKFMENESEELLSYIDAHKVWIVAIALAALVLVRIWWKMAHRYHSMREGKVRFKRRNVLLLILFIPIAHNNTWVIGDYVLPGVNATFSFTKYVEQKLLDQVPVASLHIRNIKPLPAVSKPAPFNVLLLIHESIRARSSSFYGNFYPTTPAQDQFLLKDFPDNAFIFQHAFTNSTTTKLAFPSILSGIHPAQSIQTLHKSPLFYEYGKAFQETSTFMISSQSHKYGNFQRFLSSSYLDLLWNKETSGFPTFNNHGIDDKHIVPTFKQMVNNSLQKDKNFFGVVQFNGSHFPHFVPDEDKAWHADAEKISDYEHSIHYVDAIVGDLLSHLKSSNLLKNTVIISTSDHGNGMGEHHGEIGHLKRFYNEGSVVPFWVYLPDGLAQEHAAQLNVNRHQSIQNIDIVPSIIDVLGLDENPDFDSYRASLKGNSIFAPIPENRVMLLQNSSDYHDNQFKGFGIVQNEKKFLFNERRNEALIEYYNFHEDRMERFNLWSQLTKEQQKQQLLELQENIRFRNKLFEYIDL